MELKHYLSIIWRRKWFILAIVTGTLIVVAIGNSRVTPVYTASATLRVSASLGMTQSLQYYTYNTQLMNTYVELSSSRPVTKILADRIKTQIPEIEAEVIPNTELIRITTVSPDPYLAALTSNTLALILVEQSDSLYIGGAFSTTTVLQDQLQQAAADLDDYRGDYERLIIQTPAPFEQITVAGQLLQEKQRTYETLLRQSEQAQLRDAMEASMITVVEEAVVPQIPSAPRSTLNLALAGVAGLLAGGMLAFVFESMDDKLHSTHVIETSLPFPILAKLPKTNYRNIDIQKNGRSPFAEAVRHLSARLQLEDQYSSHKVIAFMGAQPGQGTSTIIAHLGYALAEQGRKVCVVDCNLRNPSLHAIFGLPNERGVTDVFSGKSNVNDTLKTTLSGNLTLLSSGPVTDSPSLAVNHTQAGVMISALQEKFDYVLVDNPALTVADVIAVAPHADRLVLTVCRSQVRRGAMQTAGEFLSRFNGKSIQLIINKTDV